MVIVWCPSSSAVEARTPRRNPWSFEILIVLAGYSVAVALDLATVEANHAILVNDLSIKWYGGILSLFVFDSWGTIGGMLGVLAIYFLLLQGVIRPRRQGISLYLLFSTLFIGILAELIYDQFFDVARINGTLILASGESTIPEAGMAASIVLAVYGTARLLRTDPLRLDKDNRDFRRAWIVAYLALIGTIAWFVVLGQSIFVPTAAYNWRAHDISFILGLISTGVYVAVRPARQVCEPSSFGPNHARR